LSLSRIRWWPVAAGAFGLIALVAWEHHEFSAGGSRAAADGLRAAFACAVLFGSCGYAAARLLLPEELRPQGPLLVFPIGAALSSIALAALGLVHVPFGISLPLVVGAGVVTGVVARVRLGPWEGIGRGGELVWPVYVAVFVAVVALSPVWRTGFSTVVGQNGDVVLAVGSAQLVKEAPPTAIRPELPIDRIPLVWRSKYPIFYALAGVSEISGLDVVAAFPLVAAAMLALGAFGFFCFARFAMRAPPWAALAAMAAVGLGRLPVHITDHPYYNELWALFSLPFILVAGAAFLRAPGGRSLALLLLFAAIGAFAYPLMLPFPLLFIAVWAWRERASLRGFLRRPGGPWWMWVPVGLAVLALLAVLVRGVVEKAGSAAVALSPWGDLSAWSGPGLNHLPFERAFGLLDPGGVLLTALLVALVLGAAAWGVWLSPPDARVPLGVTLVAALLAAVYLDQRSQAELFYFKTMGLLGPLVVTAAAVGLVDLVRRRPPIGVAAGVAIAILVVTAALSTRREVRGTDDYASPYVLGIHDWAKAIPPNASVRIDIPPSGYQLWADYMLSPRRVCALSPLLGFFPYAQPGRKADYVLALTEQRRPRDAVGVPAFANAQFRMWRMRPGVPGPDVCTQRMTDSITKVNIA
jgi:hypothetical protein